MFLKLTIEVVASFWATLYRKQTTEQNQNRWSWYNFSEEKLPNIHWYQLLLHPYMKSLIPKGAKSTFVTLEKNVFICAVCTRVYGKLNIEFTISSFWSLYSDQKCVVTVGGMLNNVVILITRFWSKMDLAPFGIKLFIIMPFRVFFWGTLYIILQNIY